METFDDYSITGDELVEAFVVMGKICSGLINNPIAAQKAVDELPVSLKGIVAEALEKVTDLIDARNAEYSIISGTSSQKPS